MESMQLNPLAVNGPMVSGICVGTSPLGNRPDLYGYDVEETDAVATVRKTLSSPIRFLDTSNEYSDGESERRVGFAIRANGGLPTDFVLATKADPARGNASFTGARVHESFQESKERLFGAKVSVYYLHDPERFEFASMTSPGGAVEAMLQLKREGLVDAIGVAGGDIEQMRRYADIGVFDVVLNHNRYNLLDRSAEQLIDHVVSAGASFVNAAPYASGILARPARDLVPYQYRRPDVRILDRTQQLHDACRRFDVPLPALALQFSTRDPRIASTVVGVSAPERVDSLVTNDELVIPAELWGEVWDILGIEEREWARDN